MTWRYQTGWATWVQGSRFDFHLALFGGLRFGGRRRLVWCGPLVEGVGCHLGCRNGGLCRREWVRRRGVRCFLRLLHSGDGIEHDRQDRSSDIRHVRDIRDRLG